LTVSALSSFASAQHMQIHGNIATDLQVIKGSAPILVCFAHSEAQIGRIFPYYR
jgi:hypothetical protein